MASSFIIRSLARSSIESRIISKFTKPASFFNTSSPSSSNRRPFSICRLPAQLACFSDGSMYPLHSAVAAARLASRLSIPARSCSDLSQGQKYVNKINYWQQSSSSTLHLQENRCSFCTAASDELSEESEQKDKISVTFVDKDGEETVIKVPIGMSMLEAAHENDIELEGACEGSLACSTCHVIVMDMEYYNKLEDPTDEENDMLDLAFGLTETSRLGCQVIASPELDGLRLALPSATRNFAVDGYVPKPH